MIRNIEMNRTGIVKNAPVGALLLALVTAVLGGGYFALDRSADRQVMLILRGIANQDNPRGQLDDKSALEFARRSGFRGEVLDVAGNTGAESPQVKMALSRIRADAKVTAIYGFSGGGYNTRALWTQLDSSERERIRKVVIVGSPGVAKSDFPGSADVVIKSDPPAGHMAGPKALLDSLGPT
jgi:hypothetical protein